jgi:hypothetical protein
VYMRIPIYYGIYGVLLGQHPDKDYSYNPIVIYDILSIYNSFLKQEEPLKKRFFVLFLKS